MPLVPVKSEQTNAVSMTVAIPPVVRTFCDQRGLGGPLEQAIAIAQRCFGDVESWEIEMEYDPETGDEWVVVRFATRLSEEEVAEARKRYSAEWVAAVPWPERHRICLSCRIF